MSSIIIKDKFNRDVFFEDDLYVLKDNNGTNIMSCSLLSTLEAHIPENYIDTQIEQEKVNITEINSCILQMIENNIVFNNEEAQKFIKSIFGQESNIDFTYVYQNASPDYLKKLIDAQINYSNSLKPIPLTEEQKEKHRNIISSSNNSVQNF